MSTAFTLPTQTAANALLGLADRARRDPVWKGSVRGEVKFTPMCRRDRDQVWHRMRRKFRDRSDRLMKSVYYTLLYDFFSVRTGRCDPSWAAIAREAGCSISSVYRSLKRLAHLKLLNWDRRCTGAMQDGRYQLEQDTNAYHFDPTWGELPTPRPGDLELGRPDPVLDAMEEARLQTSVVGVAAALRKDPTEGSIAHLLLRLKPQNS